MALISRNDIDSLVHYIDLHSAIELYTGEVFRGGKILCPFHPDVNPSLTVKGKVFRCWSCDAGGNVIDFVRKLFNLDFRNAVRKLSDDFHLGLDIDSQERKQEPTDPVERAFMNLQEQRHEEIQDCIDNRQRNVVELNHLYYSRNQSGADASELDEIEKLIEENCAEIEFLRSQKKAKGGYYS